jgi:hypothetical protein
MIADEQLHAQTLFEAVQAGRNPRLGEKEGLAGQGDIAQERDLNESFQLTNC